MIIINAKIKVDENKREDYLQLMADLVEHSRQEKGNLFYHHYEDVSEGIHLWWLRIIKMKMLLKNTINLNTSKYLAKILVNLLLRNLR